MQAGGAATEVAGATTGAGCDLGGCAAARLAEKHCIAHVSDAELSTAVLAWRSGEPLNARNARIDHDCLRRLLQALETVELESTPGEPTGLRPSSCGTMRFEEASFTGAANFSGLRFPGPVFFDGASFDADADFGETTFTQHADFDHVTFRGRVHFRGAVFDDHVGFEAAAFEDSATFSGAKFRSYVDLEAARFMGDLDVDGATFQLARQLGPFMVEGRLSFDASVFSERVSIEASAQAVSAKASVFADGVRLSLGGATVELDRADLGRASTLAGSQQNRDAPMLLTLCGAQVAGVSVSGVDLSECRFFGAHGLETLNIEANCQWLHTPERWLCIDREMIAEEHIWRCREEALREQGRRPSSRFGVGWSHGDSDRTSQAEPGEQLDARQLAGLYRALRKAREDSKDQSGAADLYYGEMEMRRRSAMPEKRGRLRARAEKVVITGYWLLAGYGLRASRSFAALAAVILLAGVPLTLWGFHPARAYFRSVLFAAQSSLTLIHPPEAHMSASGEVVQIAIRLAGPALVGLAILSLRSRIKR